MTTKDKQELKHLQLEERRLKREILEYEEIINRLQVKGMDTTDRLNKLKKRLRMET